MKKVLSIVLAVLFVVGISAPVFAAEQQAKKAMASEEKYDMIRGEVVSLDAATKTLVVKEEKSGTQKTLKISEKAASVLKVGDQVKIKVKPGTDVAVGVKVSKMEPKKK